MTREDQAKTMPRRGGRPRAAEPGSTVTTWVPVSTHDRLIALAHQHDMSVSRLVRQLLVLRLK